MQCVKLKSHTKTLLCICGVPIIIVIPHRCFASHYFISLRMTLASFLNICHQLFAVHSQSASEFRFAGKPIFQGHRCLLSAAKYTAYNIWFRTSVVHIVYHCYSKVFVFNGVGLSLTIYQRNGCSFQTTTIIIFVRIMINKIQV